MSPLEASMAVDAAVVSEEQVPASFSSAKKIACPLRLLDCFSAADSEGIPCSLDALEPCASSTPQRATLRVRGVLLEPDESQEPRPGTASLAVVLERVTDWCIDFTGGALWLVTPHAWYRLLRPAPNFQPLFAATRRKFELTLRAVTVLAVLPQEGYESMLARILSPPAPDEDASASGGDTGAHYSEPVLLQDARFYLGALGAAVPAAREAGRSNAFMARLEDHSFGGLPRKRRAGIKYTPPPFQPLFEEEVVAQRSVLLTQRMDWRQGTSAKRARAARRRQPPPSLDSSFGVETALVGDVLSLWDLFSSFGAFLRVPPFPLSRLVAALCPDGLAEAGAGEERMRVASEAGVASGALLRDLHTSLLRVATGVDVALLAQPVAAQAEAGASAGAGAGGGARPWPEAVRAAVARAPRHLVNEEALAAAAALQEGEYADLGAGARVALLRALAALATEVDAFRDHMTAAVEEGAGAQAQLLAWEAPGAGTLEATRPWDAWACWAAVVARAPGRPLGSDLEGRRYWLLGGAAGWGRLFVEDCAQPGLGGAGAWGWYSWAQLPSLAGWLEAGGLRSAAERALARALRRTPPVPALQRDAWLAPPAAQPGRRTRREGVSDCGPDGYVGVVAPLLRGGLALGGGPAGGAGLEEQLAACVHTLLGAAPFWEMDPDWLARMRLVGAAASRAGAAGAGPALLLELEALLSESAVLLPEWGARRGAWRAEAAAGRSLAAAALAVLQLQDHLSRSGDRLSREAFLRVARAPHLLQASPPFLPALDGAVAVARSGLRAHCQHLGLPVDPALWTAMRPVERFAVDCIAFRRGDPEAEGMAALPTCWLLLSPLPGTLAHLGGGFPHGLCLPICVGTGLSDYVVDLESYEAAMQSSWSPGDRFRMFFATGGDQVLPGRKPGAWCRGTVLRVHMRIEVSAASGDGGRYVDVDPWEAYEIEWDYHDMRRKQYDMRRASPWQMDMEEGEERRRAVEVVRQHEAALRNAAKEEQAAAQEAAREARKGASKAVVPPEAEEFMQQLVQFWAARGKTYKGPIFFHQPLDVYKVFCEVQARGGYNAVTANKKWREVCSTLGLELAQVTSSSYILRNIFDRVLIAFERHLAGDTEQVDGEEAEEDPVGEEEEEADTPPRPRVTFADEQGDGDYRGGE